MKAYIIISFPLKTSSEGKSGRIANLVSSVLSRIVPVRNPDLEHLYNQVATWHVETDVFTGKPLREIGLNSDGRVVVISPWRNNYGFILDSPVTFNFAEYEHVSAEQFEHEWNSFNATNVT